MLSTGNLVPTSFPTTTLTGQPHTWALTHDCPKGVMLKCALSRVPTCLRASCSSGLCANLLLSLARMDASGPVSAIRPYSSAGGCPCSCLLLAILVLTACSSVMSMPTSGQVCSNHSSACKVQVCEQVMVDTVVLGADGQACFLCTIII